MIHSYFLRPRKQKRMSPFVSLPTKRPRVKRKLSIKSHPIPKVSPFRNFKSIRPSPWKPPSPKVSKVSQLASQAFEIPTGESPKFAIMKLFQVEPVLDPQNKSPVILGEGTYNVAFLVKDSKGQQHVLRVMYYNCNTNNLQNMNEELKLTKQFSNLSIGAPVYKSVLYKTVVPYEGTCYGTAMLMAKMDSDLDGIIRNKKLKTKVVFNANTLALTLIKSIHNLADQGYMCADIKPENVLVRGNVAFMADFDTKFCGRGSFIDRIAKKYGIQQAKVVSGRQLDPKSWKNLRDMYSRAMVYMLLRFVSDHKRYWTIRGLLFRKALVEMYEKHFLTKQPSGKRIIKMRGKKVPALEVLRYSIPGFEVKNKSGNTRFFNVQNMVQHYHGKNIFSNKIAHKWFGNFT